MSTMVDAFAKYEAIHRARIIQDTFGHLFPKGDEYEGKLKIACTMYDGVVIVDEEVEIPNSPWWYQSVHDFIFQFEDKMEVGEVRTIPIKATIVTVDGQSSIVITEL